MQTAIVELAGKTFEVQFNVIPADRSTGIMSDGIEPDVVFLQIDGQSMGEDWFDFFEKLDIWDKLEERVWKQLEGDPT